MDEEDQLGHFRQQFHIPSHNSQEYIYFTGNSLGLQPKTTREFLETELKAWEDLAVEGHFEGSNPWFHYHKFTKELLARLVGAEPGEVVSMNNLTGNLHLLMVSFYRPTKERFKIIAEAGAFPSDQYMLETQIQYHGLDPSEALIELKPRPGSHTLETSDITTAIADAGPELALVMLSGVQYYSGQFFDIPTITQAGHDVGAIVGFDLAHAAGNVPLNLHDDGVDFATWCSYKYLNSGPGGVSGIFVHDRHGNNPHLPRFGGWWGHDESQRFKMEKGFIPMQGADGWQLSNVNVLSTAAHWAALEVHDMAGMENLRAKSIFLTGYLEFILNQINNNDFEVITPTDPEQRGCQLSLLFNTRGKEVFEELTAQGVVVDWREPNVIRLAPVPLYNSYSDVYQFGKLLEKALAKEAS